MPDITKFPVRPKDNSKILDVVHSFSGCQHGRAIIDEKLAELTCADCGVKLNPLKFLVYMANQEAMWKSRKESMADLRRQLDERKRCRCTKCGEWTEIKRVGNWEAAKLKSHIKPQGLPNA